MVLDSQESSFKKNEIQLGKISPNKYIIHPLQRPVRYKTAIIIVILIVQILIALPCNNSLYILHFTFFFKKCSSSPLLFQRVLNHFISLTAFFFSQVLHQQYWTQIKCEIQNFGLTFQMFHNSKLG